MSTSISSNGSFIETRNGNIIINGKVKSLTINGVKINLTSSSQNIKTKKWYFFWLF